MGATGKGAKRKKENTEDTSLFTICLRKEAMQYQGKRVMQLLSRHKGTMRRYD